VRQLRHLSYGRVSGGERRVRTPRSEQRATRVDTTLAQSVDDEGSRRDYNNVPARQFELHGQDRRGVTDITCTPNARVGCTWR
jgi:hypothetical protein